MKRNCNLELRLVTPSVYFHSSNYDARSYNHSMLDLESESPNKKQQLTIFYNGMVASCDATEFQAKAIISLANRETEDKFKNNNSSTAGSAPCSPLLLNSPSPDYSPTTINSGLSMKRSLQRFLEKRKTRAHSLSPYPITRHQ